MKKTRKTSTEKLADSNGDGIPDVFENRKPISEILNEPQFTSAQITGANRNPPAASHSQIMALQRAYAALAQALQMTNQRITQLETRLSELETKRKPRVKKNLK